MGKNPNIQFIGDLDDDNHELWGDPTADSWHVVRYNRRQHQVVSWLPGDLPDEGGIDCARRDEAGVTYVSKGRTWVGLVSQINKVLPTPRFEKTVYGEQLVWQDVDAGRAKLIASATNLRDEFVGEQVTSLSA